MDFSKLKDFITKMNQNGVPIPLIRDPRSGSASMTATLVFISFNTALLGQIGKITNLVGSVDLTQANYLFMLSLGAYLGRRMQGNGTTKSVDMAKDGE